SDVCSSDLLLRVDLGERLDLGGVNDGGVQSGLDRLVQEHRVERLAGRWVEAEGDVGDTEDRASPGDLRLDPADRLQCLHGVAAEVVVTGAQREGECVEQQVATGQTVL